MKNWKALLGTVMESVTGPQALSFRNIEDWDNLWQVIDELRYRRNAQVFYWECDNSVRFDRSEFKKDMWYGEKIYANDLLISMEYDINDYGRKNIYIRKAYARKLKSPVEEFLDIDPLWNDGRSPNILYFTDRHGALKNPYPVVKWLELIDLWSSNGMFKPLRF